MREVHEIPKGMVQPWMIWGILGELLLGSFAVPIVAFIVTKWWPILFVIPLLIIVSYLITSKDMYRLAVWYESMGRAVKSRSLKRWGGVKTYAPR
ncbi:VirB3 family type IV secretion system protein [Burkholderia stagnalis]